MKLAQAFKDRKLRDRICKNALLFVFFEFFMYLVYFEWSFNSINFKLDCFLSSGIITIIAVILFVLGFGNKNKNFMIYGIEFFVLAIFDFLGYFALTVFPQLIMIKGKSIYSFIPLVAFLVYYFIKILNMIRKKLRS